MNLVGGYPPLRNIEHNNDFPSKALDQCFRLYVFVSEFCLKMTFPLEDTNIPATVSMMGSSLRVKRINDGIPSALFQYLQSTLRMYNKNHPSSFLLALHMNDDFLECVNYAILFTTLFTTVDVSHAIVYSCRHSES